MPRHTLVNTQLVLLDSFSHSDIHVAIEKVKYLCLENMNVGLIGKLL